MTMAGSLMTELLKVPKLTALFFLARGRHLRPALPFSSAQAMAAGGDSCIKKLAVAVAFVGTTLGSGASSRVTSLWWVLPSLELARGVVGDVRTLVVVLMVRSELVSTLSRLHQQRLWQVLARLRACCRLLERAEMQKR